MTKVLIESRLSVEECAKLIGQSPNFVRSAVLNRTLPGSYITTNGTNTFNIPRFKIYRDYLGWNEEQIKEYEKARKKDD